MSEPLDLDAIEARRHPRPSISLTDKDIGDLIAEVRRLREVVLVDHTARPRMEMKYCFLCRRPWPCLPARTAGATEE